MYEKRKEEETPWLSSHKTLGDFGQSLTFPGRCFLTSCPDGKVAWNLEEEEEDQGQEQEQEPQSGKGVRVRENT